MPRLRPLPFRTVERRLLAAGFARHSQRGSHVKFVRVVGGQTRVVIVPHHHEVAAGTIRSIIQQAGLTPDQFDQLD